MDFVCRQRLLDDDDDDDDDDGFCLSSFIFKQNHIIYIIFFLAFGFFEPASKENIHRLSTWVSDDTMGTISHNISNICRGWHPIIWRGQQLIWVALKQGDTWFPHSGIMHRNPPSVVYFHRTGKSQRWFEGAHGDCCQGSSQILAGRGRWRGPGWVGRIYGIRTRV